MASTETRTGFRLPWVSDSLGTPAAPKPETAAAEDDSPAEEGQAMRNAETSTADPAMPIEAGADEAGVQLSAAPGPAALDAPGRPTGTAPRRPTKFLADLARAMRSAAEAEREEILERFRAEAKTFSETIHERSAAEATELRAEADGDVDGIRQWSKAEIARIREETERRITERHDLLERELEAHAARVERRIEHVHGTVEAFEGEMARFFESLLVEEDPTRFAALAASLPEPPSLEAVAADDAELPAWVSAAQVEAEPEAAPVPVEAELQAAPVEGDAATSLDTAEAAEAPAEAAEAPGEAAQVLEAAPALEPEPGPEPESSMAPEVDATAESEPAAGITTDEVGPAGEAETTAHAAPVFDDDALTLDPRVAALGLTPDFGAAEAEAAALITDGSEDAAADEVPAIDDETIATRLAGLVPPAPATADLVQTRVTVSGLVSVASIAGFKRGLARLPGVESVSVSTGPDGEFVFLVSRSEAADLPGAIATMPGFSARVTSASVEQIQVVAHDPDAA